MQGKQQNGHGSEITCKKYRTTSLSLQICWGRVIFLKCTKLIMNSQVCIFSQLDEIVAIKIIELNSLKSKKLEQLLFSEIDVLKKLNHPNILKCFEVFTSNRNCYIITQLCNEGDLQSKLKAKRTYTEKSAEPYIKDIFYGLQYLAEKNVIHRDLKVANIFINNGRAKIADFGFAKFTKNKFKDINIGSPIYMSPEGLISNIYGPKTDVWAFGIMIYQLLHGETPYSHCKTQTQLKYNMSISIGWNQLKPNLSNQIKDVIIKCLEIDEAKRATAFQLSQLQYFKDCQAVSLSQKKIGLQLPARVNSSYDVNMKSPLYNDLMQNLYKPELTDDKSRLKTEFMAHNYSNSSRSFFMKEPSEIRDKLLPSAEKDQANKTGFQSYQVDNIKHERRFSSDKYINSFNPTRPISRPKNYELTVVNKNSPSKLAKKQTIISTEISFKICVNILHYCRLLYKHITLTKQTEYYDENQVNVFKRWLAVILKTIGTKIQQKKIIYQGQNAASRQRKLQQVTHQYQKKYTRELNLQIQKINLEDSAMTNYQYMYNYFYSVYQMIDNLISKETNKNLLCLGHSIIVICEGTKVLKKCFDEADYRSFQTYKDIENFLSLGKQIMDLPSYLWYRRKFQL